VVTDRMLGMFKGKKKKKKEDEAKSEFAAPAAGTDGHAR
jgi:hypothetical protein